MKHYLKSKQLISGKRLFFIAVLFHAFFIHAQCWDELYPNSPFAKATNGNLYSWGYNLTGDLGLGDNVIHNIPTKVNLTNGCWKSISASTGSFSDTFAIKMDGTLWAAGFNDHGQLGDGTRVDKNTFVQIGTSNDWQFVSTCVSCTLAIKTNGTLWCWGNNIGGLLGAGPTGDILSPVQIGTDTNWKEVSTGGSSSYEPYILALKTNGTMWAWGDNRTGQLGNGTYGASTSTNIPTQIGTASDWASVKVGLYMSFALKTNGTLWEWGSSSSIPFGNGTASSYYPILTTPTQVGTASNWKTICVTGAIHGLKTDGSIWAWGSNSSGQLGMGHNNNVLVPTQIGTSFSWKAVTAISGTTYALKNDNTIWVCGNNYRGQMGNGTFTDSNVLVPLGTINCSILTINNDSGTSTSGTVSTVVPNVRSNDIINGITPTSSNSTLTFVSSTHSGITLNTSTGAVDVASTVPAGTYTLIYNLCSICATNYCGQGTVTITVTPGITAINDNGTAINGIASTPVTNVLSNDIYDTVQVTTSNVSLTLISSSNSGLTLNTSTGAINVSASVPVGVQTLVYQICSISNPSLCSQATVTITVSAPQVIANNDSGTATTGISWPAQYGGTHLNILSNDTINGVVANYSNSIISFVSSTHAGITLSGSSGAVWVDATVPSGTYTLTYQICAKSNPTTCATAIATIYVTQGVINANNDNFLTTCVDGLAGGETPNVLLNDTFNGGEVDITLFTITLLSNGGINGLSINIYGNIVIPANTPSGNYVIYYTLHQNTIPSNISPAITVNICIVNGFNPGTGANNHVYAILRQPDGKILIGGEFTTYNNIPRNRIARLNTDMSLDMGFDPNGIGFNDAVYSLALVGSDKILVGGRFTQRGNSDAKKCLARLFPNGDIDNTFTNNTWQINTGLPVVRTIAVGSGQANGGKIFAGGSFHSVNGNTSKQLLAKFDVDGNLITSFNSYHNNNNGSINSLSLAGNSYILVGGNNLRISGSDYLLYKFKASDGTLDPTFSMGPANVNLPDKINSVLYINPDILVGGNFSQYNGVSINNIARLNSAGSVVSSSNFNPGTGSNSEINSLDRASDGFILGGSFTSYNGINRNRIAKIDFLGTHITSFNPGSGADEEVMKVLVQPDGKIILGGVFSNYNGQSAKFVTRITTANAGVLGKTLVEEVAIYPNPTRDIFNVDLTTTYLNYNKIEIYDLPGKLVYSDSLTQKSLNSINVASLPSGCYIVFILDNTNNDIRIQAKLIKQ
jgi:uncharacterized delta-60 repeat protein